MVKFRAITPADVLFLRGNRLFGGAGEHGEAQMPPWPSVFAGAVASRILTDKDQIGRITAYPGQAENILTQVAGSDFACVFLGLTRERRTFVPLPADLVAVRQDEAGKYSLRRLEPQAIPKGLSCSAPLSLVPVLQGMPKREKPVKGLWLDLEGWSSHLVGELADFGCLAPNSHFWRPDPRLGIARDRESRTAADSKIYTSEAIALTPDTCFIAGFTGKNIPTGGLLRLGGDGRGATITTISDVILPVEFGRPKPGWPGFRMILTSPGIFPDGWLPPGCNVEEDGVFLSCGSLRAELRAAAIGRHEVVSGWDMANHRPKPARKVVPTGSVYWFSVLDGDTSELDRLWSRSLYENDSNLSNEYKTARRWEGFGRCWFGAWQPR